ncbi:MAG: nucleotidyltransferase domain-containing protein [bacterium]
MPEISIKQLNKTLEKNQVKLAYLFGSQARGEAHKESDVDIAVLFDEKVNPESYLLREGRLIELLFLNLKLKT